VGRGRRAAPADLTGETIAYRAANGGAQGRHGHRAEPDQLAARDLTADPGMPREDFGPRPGYDTPGPGYDPAGPGQAEGLPRRGRDAARRGRGFGPRRGRRDYGPPGDQGDYPGGRGPGAAPAAGAGTGSPGDTQAEREARERFSLPIRRGLGGTGRFGRGGRGSPQTAPGQGERPEPALPPRRDARGGGPGAAGDHDSGAYPAGSYDRDGSRVSQDTGGYPSSSHASGGYPSGSYRDGQPSGDSESGNYDIGNYEGGSHRRASQDSGGYPGGRDSGGYPVGGYDRGGREPSGYPGGGRTDPGPAPGRDRGRGRRPSHARATRPGTPRTRGAGPGEQAHGGQADDDAALSPLPPLPPRAPRRGQWDEPDPRGRDRTAHDDQGDADW
jgi:hypothetical protein